MMVLENRRKLRQAVASLAAMLGVIGLSGCAEIEVGAEAAKRIGRATGVAGVGDAETAQLAQSQGVQLAQASGGTTQPAPISPFLRPAPDIFEATGLAIWDGKRTLQGVWVAHPLASSARRVRIFNQDNGQAVDGALFKRDAAGGGASVLISSEAAQLLSMAVGTPAELRIVAVSPIQRGTEPATSTGQVAAATTDGETEEVTPIPQTGAATEQTASATETAATSSNGTSNLSPVKPTPKPAEPARPIEAEAPKAEETPKIAAVEPAKPETAARSTTSAAAKPSPLRLPFVQAGIFGDPNNARRLIRRIEDKKIPALGREVRLSGKKATKVLAGPFQTTAERRAALRTIRAMGLKDATPVRR